MVESLSGADGEQNTNQEYDMGLAVQLCSCSLSLVCLGIFIAFNFNTITDECNRNILNVICVVGISNILAIIAGCVSINRKNPLDHQSAQWFVFSEVLLTLSKACYPTFGGTLLAAAGLQNADKDPPVDKEPPADKEPIDNDSFSSKLTILENDPLVLRSSSFQIGENGEKDV